MKPTLIFDYDGTIHNTIHIYESAFRKAFQWLVDEGYTAEQSISTERIASWLGMNSREMWNSFLPQLPDQVKNAASQKVGDYMVEQIRAHEALWYPGAEKMLDTLHEDGYQMVILSNCKVAYRQANWEIFSMDRWFDGFYDCESYGFIPKTEIIGRLAKHLQKPYIVIGDRAADLQCARACDSYFIGCRYGFGVEGELEGADVLVDSPGEMYRAITKSI
ncbi:MAG: HAD family hydrolase [Hespellia sp.]|nr:HAD family hydrolase [Hespellia sp.]